MDACDTYKGAHAVPEWSPVVAGRAGAPPLRFQGNPLCRTASGHTGISIALWRRKTPGFVVALIGGIKPDAASVRTLDEAMNWLEDVCQMPETADYDALANWIGYLDLRAAAGRAMDQWDRLFAEHDT